MRVNDNCNLSLRPDQVEKFFDEELDAVHLNDHGTRVFAHNIKVSIANTLGVRIIRSRSRSSFANQSQYKTRKTITSLDTQETSFTLNIKIKEVVKIL